MKMKKTNLLIPVIIATTIMINIGCSKDNPLNPLANACANWAEQTSNELAAYNNALSNYSSDPSVANCNSFKSAATNYYEALEDIRSCATAAGASQADINQAIVEAKNEVEEFDCSE